MQDIQPQHLVPPHMTGGVLRRAHAAAVGGGAGGHRHIRKDPAGNAPLDLLQHRVGHHQVPHTAVLFCNSGASVMGRQAVADSIQRPAPIPRSRASVEASRYMIMWKPPFPARRNKTFCMAGRPAVFKAHKRVQLYRCAGAPERSEYDGVCDPGGESPPVPAKR